MEGFETVITFFQRLESCSYVIARSRGLFVIVGALTRSHWRGKRIKDESTTDGVSLFERSKRTLRQPRIIPITIQWCVQCSSWKKQIFNTNLLVTVRAAFYRPGYSPVRQEPYPETRLMGFGCPGISDCTRLGKPPGEIACSWNAR